MNNYFDIDEKFQIDSFLQIPKILFTDKYKTLSTNAKLIYSLYLNRYVSTRFKDEDGVPYIIFSDKELASLINISTKTCQRAKVELTKLEMILIQKTVSYNKIYLYSLHQSDDKEFYNQKDLELLQFYKFPSTFFDETFNCLTNNTKLLYVYYLDFITLSQKNSFADKQGRIFFYDDSITQGEDVNLSQKTVTSARHMLYASGLLFKYQPFGGKVQYYLKKLNAFDEESLIKYIELSTKDQKEYLKEKSKIDNSQFSKNVSWMDKNKEKLSTEDSLVKMSSSDMEKCPKQFSVLDLPDSSIVSDELSKKDSHIINTKIKKTNENNYIINYIKTLKEYNHLVILDETRQEFIDAVLSKLEQYPRFILNRDGTKVQLEANDIYEELVKIEESYQFGQLVNTLIDRIYTKGYLFKTPESQINCFLTFLFNELINNENLDQYKKPNWFNSFSFANHLKSTSDNEIQYDDSVKNYNWWE